MVRAGPDVEEDQRPEVDDRQPIGIDRPLGALWNEVIHDGKEAGGQEEADRVVPVPPLEHGVLHPAPGDVGFRTEHRDRQRRIVAEMKHGDGDDEGKIEPVGDEDMRLFSLDDGHQEDQQVHHPNDRQPQIRVPFRFGIFLGLGYAEQIAGAGNQDEEVVADDNEPRREIAR
jgi:23S rRNA (cytosine1962-C5)-methyltransferase